MSDFSIPGVSSKYNTDKLIEDLMKLERVPLERAEERIDKFELQKTNWQEMNRDLARVDENAKKLYGFQNPFMDRIADSDNERVLTATATREAVEETRSIRVIQTAKADRFLSDNLDTDFHVESGEYTLSVGDQSFSFNYSGGTLRDFASIVQRRSNGLIRTSVVKNTPDTQVLLIEGTKTGSSNRLEFKDEAKTFALSTGLLQEHVANSRNIQPSETNVKPLEGSANLIEEGLSVDPQSSREILFTPAVNPGEDDIVEFTVTVEKLEETPYVVPDPPPGPTAPGPGTVSLEGISISNLASSPDLPAWAAPPPPEKVLDMNVLTFTGSSKVPVNISDIETPQKISLKASDLPSTLNSLIIDNQNTHRRITVSQINIYNPNARGDAEPKNPVDTANNAIIEVDGIEVIRESNEIDDIIQGVTLNLKHADPDPVEINVTPDRETVKDSIIEFIGYYNQLISQINIYTSRDDAVINELDYLDDDEREKAQEQLGLFQGESSLTQMKTRLQTIMMNPYTTREGSEMSLLAQMGISTNSSTGGELRTSRLRGYLEIDENALDKALETRLDAVKDLFGYDSDGDLIVDQGVGFSVDAYIKPYIQTGGIIAYKTSAIDGQIDRTNREIDSLERSLERKEQQLRREYGMMEGALQQMQENSKALDNFSSNGNGN